MARTTPELAASETPAAGIGMIATPSGSALLKVLPWLIALAALLLRLWGIGWALPNEGRLFSYHPDESVVVGKSLPVNPLLLLLDPGFYNYGSLPLLVNGFFIDLGEWVGLVGQSPELAKGLPVPSSGALLTARLVTAFLGAGTCLFLFHVGRLLYGASAGAFTALLYAVAPLPVQHGHFATVDVPATFWIAGALYFAARHVSDERGRRDLLWCGLWSGLAAAAKYNAGLVLLSGVVAWWLAKPRSVGTLAGLLGLTVAGFLLGCPGVLLNFAQFQKDLRFEANHVREGHGDVFKETPPGFVYHLTYNLPWGLGWPVVAVCLVGLAFAFARRRPGDWTLLAFLVPYYLLIGLPAVQIKFARYCLPLLPAFLPFAGALFSAWRDAKPVQRAANAALLAAAGFALFLSCGFNTVMTGPDPRDLAADEIKKTGIASVGFATGPWFYSPPLNPLLAAPYPPVARGAAAQNEFPRLFPCLEGGDPNKPVEWSVALLNETAPRAVVISEINESDALRIRDPKAVAYRDALTAAYPNRKVFSNPVTFLGVPITRPREPFGFPVQDLPHDMVYTNPTTVLYTK
jgi:hypothetical protein